MFLALWNIFALPAAPSGSNGARRCCRLCKDIPMRLEHVLKPLTHWHIPSSEAHHCSNADQPLLCTVLQPNAAKHAFPAQMQKVVCTRRKRRLSAACSAESRYVPQPEPKKRTRSAPCKHWLHGALRISPRIWPQAKVLRWHTKHEVSSCFRGGESGEGSFLQNPVGIP